MTARAGIALALFLTACSPAQRDELTRDAARAAITPVVVERFPGVPLQPALDCLIGNASSPELLSLAADSVTGPTASTREIVTRIAARPETLRCLATGGLDAFVQ